MRNFDTNIQERRHKIIAMLRENDQLSVKELSDTFAVSEVTVRRDLDTLAAKNLVERSRGRVKLSQNIVKNLTFFEEKSTRFLDEKDRIAKKAAERIESGDVVFVNAGTTVLFLPKHISEPDVKIVTNNPCMATTEGNENINLFITGGERYLRTQSLVGDICMYALSRVKANKCILSVNGITAESGITSSYYMETAVNAAMLSHCSGERIVIADSSKIGIASSFISAGIDMIDTLITVSTADPEELEKLSRAGVDVVFAD